MFKKILIANRGEIACRVMRTAKRMGIRTVAVHSDADASALHVAMADEAYQIGPALTSESYLHIGRIIEACVASGAEAVHPGYGFLSENPTFVEAVEAAGLAFVGPSADAIRAMGLKDAAKDLMERANVPVVPGYHGDDQDPDVLAEKADELGYPILIKARAGGGGKGMRRVDDPGDFRSALESASREADASFGDGHCLLERYLTKPRHIEIQIFGDDHGSVVHLFERDCSLQRRHQKVIEEAPAPGMTDAMRSTMGEAAVRAARAIGYSGAGTVEFIADVSGGLSADHFYFMEMNTRLQVEHPVTEMITGLDLVEWQFRVAAGEPLPLAQSDLSIDGWAFEARVYAEDASKGFMPATGRLAHISFPEGLARVDTGVRQGADITSHYDPMIAKLVVHGPDREVALERLSAALRSCEMVGVTSNIAFLDALATHPEFAGGDVDTGLIDRNLEDLIASPKVLVEALALASLAALDLLNIDSVVETAYDPWSSRDGWRLWGVADHVVVLANEDGPIEIGVAIESGRRYRIGTPEGVIEIDILETNGLDVRCRVGDRMIRSRVVRLAELITVFMAGHAFAWAIPDPLAKGADKGNVGDGLIAPMPGLIKAISVAPGQHVTEDAPVMMMEAMKMELVLRAPRDGVVGEVLVEVDDQVDEGALLLMLIEAQGEAA